MDSHYAVGLDPMGETCSTSLLYRLTADSDPGLLPRVLEVFAKRSLVPDAVRAERCADFDRSVDDRLSVELRIPPMEAAKARHVAACLRETVGVRTVLGPVALDSD